MQSITLLAFGSLTDVIKTSRLELTDVATTDELKQKLETAYPALKNMSYAIAVNKKIVAATTVLEHNATVAILPPFSGG